MKISVVIPCHNAGPWIQEALRSVAEQTYQPHEIIVVDDGSTDDSVDKIRSSGVEVRLLRCDYGNAATARNAGIEVAIGDWLAFLDADNRWFSHHLWQGADLLCRGDDRAYICWSSETSRINGQVSKGQQVYLPDAPVTELDPQDFVRWRLAGGYGFATSGMIAETDLVRSVGGFDDTQVRRHDFELFMRLILSNTWCFHPNPSWYSRPPRPGNISSNQVECRYYALRAYVLNAERFSSPVMLGLIQKQAKNSMNTALDAGDREQIDRVWELAREWVSPPRRAIYRAARNAPSIAVWIRAVEKRVADSTRGIRRQIGLSNGS